MAEKSKGSFIISIENTKFEMIFREGCTIYHLGPVVIFSYDKEMSKSLKENMRYLIGMNKNMDFNVPPELDDNKAIVIMAGWGEKTGRYTLNFFNREGDGSMFLSAEESKRILGRA